MSIAEYTDTVDTAPWDEFLPPTDEPPTLALSDRAGADRHLAAIARIEREYDLEQAGALAEIQRLQRWIAARYEATVAQTDWHRGILHRYHEAVLAVDPRLKTIKLPHGELQARAQQPEWKIDGPVFLAWARENLPEAVRPAKPTEPTVDVAAAKRLLVSPPFTTGETQGPALLHGEIVEGIVVVNRPPKFSTIPAVDEPAPKRETPAERIVGVNWHSAACVDDEGKVECTCGLDDARERAADMHDDGPPDHREYAEFQADQAAEHEFPPGDEYADSEPF